MGVGVDVTIPKYGRVNVAAFDGAVMVIFELKSYRCKRI